MNTAQAQYELGVKFRDAGDSDAAIERFQAALDLDSTHHPSYIAAAEIFSKNGLALQAMNCYGCALQLRPQDGGVQEKFIMFARYARFAVHNPQVKALLLLCLQNKAVDFSYMGGGWLTLLQTDPAFGPLYKALQKDDYESFVKAFERLPDHKALLDPVFILALKRPIRIPDIAYETFLTHLRHLLLDGGISGNDQAILSDALASYCAYTEYVFDVSDDEQEKLAVPRQNGIVSCYRPLQKTGREEIIKRISSLTPISSGISELVKAQYEESPYPRWITYSTQMYNEDIEGCLVGKKAKILIAGCGTGREAIELAHVFPDAEVLGIDLSYASLAYATEKAEEFGIKNIAFRQADILGLPGKIGPFDYVASTGVIHHMESPKAGWDVLTGLLKPGGLLRVGLYSRKSRESLYAAHEVIAAKGFTSSADDIRRFRRECKNLLKKKDYLRVIGYADFYSLSECRDLLFHAHEQDFELPKIEEWIKQSGMKFLGFNASADVIADYKSKNPQDPGAINLKLWAEYEEDHPEAFTGMYTLWLRKNH